MVEQHKGHTAQEHEDGNHPIKICDVIISDTCVFGWIPRCRYGPERMTQWIEKGHAAETQQHRFQDIQSQVDPPEPDHDISIAGDEFFFGNHLPGTRLGSKNAHAAHAVRKKNNGQG